MKMWMKAAIVPAVLVLAACNQQPAAPGAPGAPGVPAAPGVPTPSATGLTGPDREAFVSSAVTSCSAKQQNDPANQGISMAMITSFCTCYANRMADRIPMSELPALTTADPVRMQAMLQDRINEASTTCASQVRGAAPGSAPAPGGQPSDKQ